MRSGTLRSYHICDRFCLGEVHLAIDKSATRELSRSRNTRTCIDKKLENSIDNESGGMAGK